MFTNHYHACLSFLAIDDCRGVSSGSVVQSYEDLVRNYVVSHTALNHGKYGVHVEYLSS